VASWEVEEDGNHVGPYQTYAVEVEWAFQGARNHEVAVAVAWGLGDAVAPVLVLMAASLHEAL
jgi:hypothetical protein